MSGDISTNFRKHLQNVFLERCRKNPRYSIRSFARALKLDHSTLSQLLRGRRTITNKTIQKLAPALGLDFKEQNRFLNGSSNENYHDLTLDTYQVIADWFHFAVFELVTLKDFNPQYRWIANRLGITVTEAQLACERLFRVGLLEKDKKGLWKQSKNFITTTGNPFTDAAFRKLQKGVLEGGLKALEDIPFEMRDQTSMTMAIHTRQLPEARKKIKEFRRSLCESLQKETDRNAVYQLGISFYPLTKITKIEEKK